MHMWTKTKKVSHPVWHRLSFGFCACPFFKFDFSIVKLKRKPPMAPLLTLHLCLISVCCLRLQQFFVFHQWWSEKAADQRGCCQSEILLFFVLLWSPWTSPQGHHFGNHRFKWPTAVQRRRRAAGINNESSDYMPRAKPQFSVCLAGSQLFTQLDTEQ